MTRARLWSRASPLRPKLARLHRNTELDGQVSQASYGPARGTVFPELKPQGSCNVQSRLHVAFTKRSLTRPNAARCTMWLVPTAGDRHARTRKCAAPRISHPGSPDEPHRPPSIRRRADALLGRLPRVAAIAVAGNPLAPAGIGRFDRSPVNKFEKPCKAEKINHDRPRPHGTSCRDDHSFQALAR